MDDANAVSSIAKIINHIKMIIYGHVVKPSSKNLSHTIGIHVPEHTINVFHTNGILLDHLYPHLRSRSHFESVDLIKIY